MEEFSGPFDGVEDLRRSNATQRARPEPERQPRRGTTSWAPNSHRSGSNARCATIWAIENSPHWALDTTMNEDRQRNRTGHGPENLALMRRMALHIARNEPGKDAMRGKLERSGWDNRFLLETGRAAVNHRQTTA